MSDYDYFAIAETNIREFPGRKISEETKAVLCNAMATMALAQELRDIRTLLERKLR